MIAPNKIRQVLANMNWRILAMILGATILFVYGIGVGHYHWPPFELLQQGKSVISQNAPLNGEYQGEQELLQYAFVDPTNETELYYSPITSLAGIRVANERIFMTRMGFEQAYDALEILGADQLNRPPESEPVLRVRFRYCNREYGAFFYGRLPASCSGQGSASLVIPGSGLNQSLNIAAGNPANYHYGILNALAEEEGQVYILIKPNEDFLAWHDGKNKMVNLNFIVQYHLNKGGSYSVSHLVQALAATKWINTCFDYSIVAGLSSGGATAMLVALQAYPNVAIVSAGYSFINSSAKWSSITGLMGVPGFGALDLKENALKRLRASSTNWFFSWGKAEVGTYRIEAEERITANAIEHLPNVTISIHPGGHIFPVSEIKSFLRRVRATDSKLPAGE